MKAGVKLLLPAIIGLLAGNCSHRDETRQPAWKGKIRTESGITIVQNPKDPIYAGSAIRFEPDSTIGSDPDVIESYLGHILSFAVDDRENVIIYDLKNNCLKVFDRDGRFLRSIGRKGQGPGEFQLLENIQWTNQNTLMAFEGGRRVLMFFSGEGRLLNEVKTGAGSFASATYVDQHGDLYASRLIPGHVTTTRLDKLSADYKVIKTLATYSQEGFPKYPPPQLRYVLLPGNRLALGLTSKYEVNLVDSEANQAKKITREHVLRRVPDEYKARILDLIPSPFKASTKFEDIFPAFDLLSADDKGRLFIKTFEQEKGTGKWVLDIFDADGRFLTQAALAFPFETSTSQEGKLLIKADKIYVKDYDEEGYPVIKRYRIVENVARRPPLS